MSRRRLSDEERAIWKGFARGVRPLRPFSNDKETGASDAPDRELTRSRRGIGNEPLKPKIQQQPPALAQFDRRLRQRVARSYQNRPPPRSAWHDAATSACRAPSLPTSSASGGCQAGARGHRQGPRCCVELGIRTRRAAAAGPIVGFAAGVPPLYCQFRAGAKRARRRGGALSALAAPRPLTRNGLGAYAPLRLIARKPEKTHESVKLDGKTSPTSKRDWETTHV
jgi:hypothetical protein